MDYEDIGDIKGKGICYRIIRGDLFLAQKKDMYRKGHNHALMLDAAVLTAWLKIESLRNIIDLPKIIQRALITRKLLFSENGITKEHSLSYQEYNLKVCCDFDSVLKKFPCESYTITPLMHKTKEQSLVLLNASLRNNGEYFAIGDTNRKPNLKLLNGIYKDVEKHLFNSHYNSYALYFDEGFFVYRNIVNNTKIHFFATCSWFSHNHKQNDELSFCLDINDRCIFDDPGYAAFGTVAQDMEAKSELSHSTLTIEGQEWSDKKLADKSSKFLNVENKHHGFLLSGTHKRMASYQIYRYFSFDNGLLTILDRVKSDEDKIKKCRHRFVLGKKISPLIDASKVSLFNGEDCLVVVDVENGDGYWDIGSCIYVDSNPYEIKETKCIDYYSDSDSDTLFKIINQSIMI